LPAAAAPAAASGDLPEPLSASSPTDGQSVSSSDRPSISGAGPTQDSGSAAAEDDGAASRQDTASFIRSLTDALEKHEGEHVGPFEESETDSSDAEEDSLSAAPLGDGSSAEESGACINGTTTPEEGGSGEVGAGRGPAEEPGARKNRTPLRSCLKLPAGQEREPAPTTAQRAYRIHTCVFPWLFRLPGRRGGLLASCPRVTLTVFGCFDQGRPSARAWRWETVLMVGCGTVCRAPTLLVLHLKRFACWDRGIKKINAHVAFPFDLDVSKYMDPQVEPCINHSLLSWV
jgi:Ubiquitin carboxyl-terminal hydrolase